MSVPKFVDLETISKKQEAETGEKEFVLTDEIAKEHKINDGDILYVYEAYLSPDNGFRLVREIAPGTFHVFREDCVSFDPYDDIDLEERLEDMKEEGYEQDYRQAFKDAMAKAEEWM